MAVCVRFSGAGSRCAIITLFRTLYDSVATHRAGRVIIRLGYTTGKIAPLELSGTKSVRRTLSINFTTVDIRYTGDVASNCFPYASSGPLVIPDVPPIVHLGTVYRRVLSRIG